MSNLEKKSTNDLLKLITEKREELRAFRFGEAGSRTRNVRAGRAARKEIARMLTEIRRRELSSVAESGEDA